MHSSRLSSWRVRCGAAVGEAGQRQGALIGLAILVGVTSGLGAVLFRFAIVMATKALTGRPEYSDSGGAAHPWLPGLGRWFVIAVPVLAGLIYGPVVHRWAREARGHGVPEVMFAVARRGGRIPGRVAAVKALASALCIGGGGSVGREGPIVQIGSAAASWLGQLVRLPEARLRTLVACGAAGGIAATFNAPIAGVFFALELILGTFAADAFGAVVLSAVTASVIGRAAFGNTPFLRLPAFEVQSGWEYPLYVLLGVFAALAGVMFVKVLYAFEDGCDWIWRGPEWARPAVGGLALGVVLLVLPEMYGVGYPIMQNAVEGRYVVGFLILLLLAKIVATSLTIGIGGSGGVFAPSLFIGAMLGAAFGSVARMIDPGAVGPVGAYALVGMGALFAAAGRAPITAVIIMFELTGEYTIILPLMLAVVVATGLSKVLSRDSVYTEKLRRRGVDLSEPSRQTLGAGVTVGEVMAEPPTVLDADLSLADAVPRFLQTTSTTLPVRRDGQLVGVVTAAAVSGVLTDDEDADQRTVMDVLEQPVRLSVETPLSGAVSTFTTSGTTAAVVVDDAGTLLGWVTQGSLLAGLHPATNGDREMA
jgi:chloride channel protein, CIC family